MTFVIVYIINNNVFDEISFMYAEIKLISFSVHFDDTTENCFREINGVIKNFSRNSLLDVFRPRAKHIHLST